MKFERPKLIFSNTVRRRDCAAGLQPKYSVSGRERKRAVRRRGKAHIHLSVRLDPRTTSRLLRGRPCHSPILNRKRFAAVLTAACVPFFVLILSIQTARAGSATWSSNPGSGDWNTAANWTPPTGYPNGAGDTATFDVSNTTAVSLSASVQVDGIIFNSGASAYTITASDSDLTVSGTGIANNSGVTQNLVADVIQSGGYGRSIYFTNNATAGSSTIFTAKGAFSFSPSSPGAFGGTIQFFNTTTASSGTFAANGSGAYGYYGGFIYFFNDSSAANGTFTADGAAPSGGFGGFIDFRDSSTAGNGIFTANGSAGGQRGGFIDFYDSSTASNGTFTADAGIDFGGIINFDGSSTASNGTFTANGSSTNGSFGTFIGFYGSSTADNATLVANSGTARAGQISFLQTSTGGTSRVEVFGGGSLYISGHDAPGVAIGSLEGDGQVYLDHNNLTVGSNNLSTIFSGTMQDFGEGGSVTKIGTGTLTLSGANSYTGSTTVSAGAVLVNNFSGSGTGTGAVTVSNNGTVLGGTGTISGPVNVNAGAALLGGNGTAAGGALTLGNDLTLASGSIIQLVLGASGAHSTLTRTGGTWTFASNQAFTFINSGAQPGVYDNIITGLAADPGTEGSWMITNPGFTGTFSYDGAGNIDLTLTAVHPQVTAAVSRKLHTGVGTFPLNLPLNGTLGVECRKGGATGDHQLVISFTNNVSVNGNPQAAVTSGQGQVGTGGTSNGGVVSVSGADVTVPLTNVTNAQTITVTLFGVNDGTNSGDVGLRMGVLVGDTNADTFVNSSDIGQTKSQSFHTVDSSNFREDVNVDGSINSSDIGLVKSKSFTALPP